MKRNLVSVFALVGALIVVLVGCSTPSPTTTVAVAPTTEKPPQEQTSLILATTTSTENSGLLTYILPDFEAAYNARVDVIAVGTGQALKMGEDGNADVLLVHARAREDAFMEAQHGVRREDVMYNDFVIVGPENDPAGIAGMTEVTKAMAKIAKAKAIFVSRGDDSGTHTKEKAIWQAAGVEPSGDWYVSAGQGMGAVLTMADEQQAYTLSDRATYLARTLEGTDLQILVEGDPTLFNPYGVIAVNPTKSAKINADLAQQFIDWLISEPVQAKIGEFGVAEFGSPLFAPDSAPWRAAHPASGQPSGEGSADAALKVTGLVDQEMDWSEDQVKAMETMEVESTNQSGEVDTYTGVSIVALLDLAKPKSKAQTVVYVADDGFTGEAPLADVTACADCIVSFRNKGGFSIVMPGFPGNVQVKGVVEIQVK